MKKKFIITTIAIAASTAGIIAGCSNTNTNTANPTETTVENQAQEQISAKGSFKKENPKAGETVQATQETKPEEEEETSGYTSTTQATTIHREVPTETLPPEEPTEEYNPNEPREMEPEETKPVKPEVPVSDNITETKIDLISKNGNQVVFAIQNADYEMFTLIPDSIVGSKHVNNSNAEEYFETIDVKAQYDSYVIPQNTRVEYTVTFSGEPDTIYVQPSSGYNGSEVTDVIPLMELSL